MKKLILAGDLLSAWFLSTVVFLAGVRLFLVGFEVTDPIASITAYMGAIALFNAARQMSPIE